MLNWICLYNFIGSIVLVFLVSGYVLWSSHSSLIDWINELCIQQIVFICIGFAGDAQIGLNVTPIDPSMVANEVWYGKESGKYSMKKKGVSMVYSQLYPFEGLWNYTSGIIHHVIIDGKEVTQLFLLLVSYA